ncbi:MAG: hypothetical protein CME90_11415 [Hoeflea sp.]|nr:hypothetical protein [Hoeflea sp.]|tara:strand:+ start:13735 stop:14142 length:408 start_codon:yes stop_codon:yes gene_type:complete
MDAVLKIRESIPYEVTAAYVAVKEILDNQIRFESGAVGQGSYANVMHGVLLFLILLNIIFQLRFVSRNPILIAISCIGFITWAVAFDPLRYKEILHPVSYATDLEIGALAKIVAALYFVSVTILGMSALKSGENK